MPKAPFLQGLTWPFASWQCGHCSCEQQAQGGVEDVHVPNAHMDMRPPGDGGCLINETLTPRQRELQEQLQLPALESYPLPPGCNPQQPLAQVRQVLLEMYHSFALDLHRGMYLTQLMVDRSHADIHCQLMEDMSTLKLDQSNGRIIEFPLANVSKVYRLTKLGNKLYPAEKQRGPGSDQIIVVVFSKRKLAFVFKELKASLRFAFCLELLIWRAQQLEGVPLLRSVLSARHPAVAVQAPQTDTWAMASCPTPRLVRDSNSSTKATASACKDPPDPGRSCSRTSGGATGSEDEGRPSTPLSM